MHEVFTEKKIRMANKTWKMLNILKIRKLQFNATVNNCFTSIRIEIKSLARASLVRIRYMGSSNSEE